MTKSNEIKMTYEQIQQLAGYLEHLRGNIETVNQKTHFFKRSLNKENLNSFNRMIDGNRHVRRSVRDYVEASVVLNDQIIEALIVVEQALINSNDKDKVDELFGVKK